MNHSFTTPTRFDIVDTLARAHAIAQPRRFESVTGCPPCNQDCNQGRQCTAPKVSERHLDALQLERSTHLLPRHALRVVTIDKPSEQVLILGASASELPPMNMPQATEPAHIGTAWRAPAPVRDSRPSKRTNTIVDTFLGCLLIACITLTVSSSARGAVMAFVKSVMPQ